MARPTEDDELQELARRAWPDSAATDCRAVEAGYAGNLIVFDKQDRTLMSISRHPRAAEAMRAALLVLATKGAADE